MAGVLFLAHRIPYPPNKGDKIRSWHFFEHLAKHHKVHLGCFVDARNDLKHIPFLQNMSESLCFQYASPLYQRLRSLSGLASGIPLTLAAYPQARMKAYVETVLAQNDIRAIFLFSAAVGQFVPIDCNIPVFTDLVDVDSEKWAAYARKAKWPVSALYRREARALGAYEQNLACRSAKTFLVSAAEALLLQQKMPGNNDNIVPLKNGVDVDMFDPRKYPACLAGKRVIFTGAMNYPPNIEAVEWFCRAVWPAVRKGVPDAVFRIAGGPRVSRVDALAKTAGVEVIGYVESMAAEIAASALAVAPLQTARGVQNKVLEAMAMAKNTVATSLANEGIDAVHGKHIWLADNAEDFAATVIRLLTVPPQANEVGTAARGYVKEHFSWQTSCTELVSYLQEASCT